MSMTMVNKRRLVCLLMAVAIIIGAFQVNAAKVNAAETGPGYATVYQGVDYSRVYDYYYYISNNADVKLQFGDNNAAVLWHFVNYGMREGRQAKATFDVRSYKNAYSDLRLAFGNDLRKYYEHYIRWGYKENRVTTGVKTVKDPITKLDGVDYSKVYDFHYYQKKNADIKKAFGDDDIATLKHFVKYGMKEGRKASPKFDLKIYKKNNQDLVEKLGNGKSSNEAYYLNYINEGYNLVRNAMILDDTFYVDDSSDIVFVGDSRTFGMFRACYGLGGSFLARGGARLDWLKEQLPKLYDLKGKNIFINMGVNDLYNAAEYTKFYNSLPNSFVKNNKIIFLTVGPVDEELAKKCHMTRLNKNIEKFNHKVKNEIRSDILYLDSYNYLKKYGFSTYDGLHYTDDTMKKLYNWAKYNASDLQRNSNENCERMLTTYNNVNYYLVYDYWYYMDHNPDLQAAFGDNEAAALEHFVKYGMKEGRQANQLFNAKIYRSNNSDLRTAYGDDLQKYYEHFMKWGFNEHRSYCGSYYVKNPATIWNGVDYSKVYDYNYYIKRYPDLREAYGNNDVAVLKHFVEYGMKEGRQAIASFNVKVYRKANKDLRAAYGNDFRKYYEHYIKWGYKEKRVTK